MSQKIYTNLDIKGNATIGDISNATSDTDKFLVSDAGVVKYRTGSEMLSDLGVAPGVASNVQHQVKAGVAINKGQAVYVTSADGTNMIVGLASNSSEATSSKTMGLLDNTVAINGFANVVTEGLLSGLNTIGANAGDPVWLGTGGNLIYGLANKPSAPAHLVFIGVVTRVNANNGEIFIKAQNGFELNEIHDVDLKTTSPSGNEILAFEGAPVNLWKNKTIPGVLGYTPANDSSVVHLTGSEIITGSKSFFTSNSTAITVLNSNSTFSGQRIQNNSTNSGLLVENTSTGIGIDISSGSSTGKAIRHSSGAFLSHLGDWNANSFIKIGGTSSQFLKADGSVDTSSYYLASNPNGYITSYTETNTFLGDGGNAGTHPGTDRIIFTGQLSTGAALLGMPATDNSNAILNINRHPGEYNSQLGFSSNGSMYYRSFSAAAINSTQTWRQVWDSGNFTNNSSNWDTAFGWGNHASAGYLTSVTNITGYARSLNGFANQTEYTILDGPANGPVWKVRYDSATANRYIDFGFKDGNGVYSTGLKIYNGDTPTWQGSTLLHAGNYSSYAVPSSRTITINGTSYDLSSDRSWTVTANAVETDTLATVTARGNTTTGDVNINGKIRVGSFPNSVVNNGEAWLGRAADRLAGTMTVQLGGNLDRKFEVVDYGWTTVNFQVNGYGAAEASGSMRSPIFYDSLDTSYYLNLNDNSRLYRLLVHRGIAGGGQNIFTGLEGVETANGRGQIVISSSYSDMVIASSQDNNQHGSTLTFAAYNPSNSGQYRKFVVNQGNWGSRKHMLSFGYSDTEQSNPHSAINSGVNTLTLDGLNRRVGIKVEDPGYTLEVGGDVYSNSSRSGIFYRNNNTAYYWEPSADTSHRFQTPNGYIDIGPKNGGTCHIYTDRPSFYFNKDLIVNGSTVLNTSNAPRAANSYVMFYEGFTLNADSMSTNSTGFTYSVNAPWTGPIARFSTGGGYDLWLNASYGGNGVGLSYRTRNGDAGTYNSWHRIYSDSYRPYSDNSGTVGGYSVSTGGNANTIPTRNASGYLSPSNWTQLDGYYGLYSPNNNAHFYPNNNTYGSWRISGSRNGWGGIEFDYGSAGAVVLMMSSDSNTTGFHNNSYGWQVRWANGTLYSGRGSYGGSDSIVLQEDKWINSKHFGSDGAIYVTAIYDSNNSGLYLDPSNGGDSIRVAGDIVAYYSDERLKDRKKNIENALNKVLSLNGFYYTPNSIAQELGYLYKEEVGVSAQEVQEVLPEIIKDAPIGYGYKTLDYGRLTPLLIEAIKEQQTQIEELKELVNKLINK